MHFYEEKFFRNIGVINKASQKRIKSARFAIIGMGGTGGFVLENLLRMGVENFILFDFDRFELSNFNRQMLATDYSVDLPKVDVARARAKSINPTAKVEVHHRKFSEHDAKIISKCDIVIDCCDNVESHAMIASLCKKLKVPMVFCTAAGSLAMVSVFINSDFFKTFQISKEMSKYNKCSDVICPGPAISGSLAAMQAMKILLKRPYVKAPDVLFCDLMEKQPFYIKRLK